MSKTIPTKVAPIWRDVPHLEYVDESTARKGYLAINYGTGAGDWKAITA